MKISRFAVGVSLTMLALGAESVTRSAQAWNPEPESRKQVQLDLAFRQLRQDMNSRHLSADSARMEMARWDSANATLIKQAAKEVSESLMPPIPPPIALDPGAPPSPQGKKAEDFFGEAAAYKAHLVRFIMDSPAVKGDPEKGRLEIARRMATSELRNLDNDVLLLVATEKSEASDAEPPLKPEEMLDFTPAEKADAEIYAAIYQATQRPLANGEEIRDRIAPLEESLKAKKKIVMAADAAYLKQDDIQRQETLETQLEQLSQ